jgi:hypothetical protein
LLERIVRSARSGALIGMGLYLLSCSKDPPTQDPISSVPVWQQLANQTIQEDSEDGTVIYVNLKDKASYPGTITFSSVPTDHFQTYFDGKDLKIKSLLHDYAGDDTVKVYANEKMTAFILSITNVDDPPHWLSLQAQSIAENSGDGTIIFPNIESRLYDPDSPKIIIVDGTYSHFEAYYQKPDLRIKNLERNYFGQDSVFVNGNGLRKGFLLTVSGDDAPLQWSTVPGISCNEDANRGTTLLENVSSYAYDPDTPVTIQDTYQLGEATLKIQDGDLILDYLQSNWNGTKSVTLTANNVSSGQFSFTVTPVDDPAQWGTLPDCHIPNNPPDGIVALADLASYAADIDSPLQFAVTGTYPYTLHIQEGNLVISNVPEGYSGLEHISLTCNTVPATLDLTVNAPFLSLLFHDALRDSYGDVDIWSIFMNENMIALQGYNGYDRIYNPDFSVRESYTIDNQYIFLHDNGQYLYAINIYSGNLHRLDRRTFNDIDYFDFGEFIRGIATASNQLFVMFDQRIAVYDPSSMDLQRQHHLSYTLQTSSSYASLGRLVHPRNCWYPAEQTIVDTYNTSDFSIALSQTKEGSTESQRMVCGSGQYAAWFSGFDINVINVQNATLQWQKTMDWAIEFITAGPSVLYVRKWNNQTYFYDLETGTTIPCPLNLHATKDAVGFFSDKFYIAEGNDLYIYKVTPP